MINIEELHRTIKKKMVRRFAFHPDFDDGLQEAYIRVWKDMEDGITDFHHLANRAFMWGREVILSDHHLPTGNLGRERLGLTTDSGNKNREKISQFVNEYTELHDKSPSATVIAQAVGLNRNTVHYHLKHIKERSFSVLTRSDGHTDNRLDRRRYQQYSLDGFSSESYDDSYQKAIEQESFEEDVLARDNFMYMINLLDEEYLREIVTLNHVYQWSQRSIGKRFGVAQNRIRRDLIRAYEIIKEKL